MHILEISNNIYFIKILKLVILCIFIYVLTEGDIQRTKLISCIDTRHKATFNDISSKKKFEYTETIS